MPTTTAPLDPAPLHRFRVDALDVRIYPDRATLGRAAAIHVGGAIAARLAAGPDAAARLIFAAAPSQDEFLRELVARPEVDWRRIVAFHMDEYLGLAPDHASAFRLYLHRHLFWPAQIASGQLRLIPAESRERPGKVCLEYEERLRAEPPDITCAGIGENGHLAFNDPPVADFADPQWVKVVRLDAACRAQQVHDGGFARLDDVPTHAITLTIPALLAAPVVSVVVPGPRKAEAVRATLKSPIDERCPATALRRHPGAVLFLDRESAAGVR